MLMYLLSAMFLAVRLFNLQLINRNTAPGIGTTKMAWMQIIDLDRSSNS